MSELQTTETQPAPPHIDPVFESMKASLRAGREAEAAAIRAQRFAGLDPTRLEPEILSKQVELKAAQDAVAPIAEQRERARLHHGEQFAALELDRAALGAVAIDLAKLEQDLVATLDGGGQSNGKLLPRIDAIETRRARAVLQLAAREKATQHALDALADLNRSHKLADGALSIAEIELRGRL